MGAIAFASVNNFTITTDFALVAECRGLHGRDMTHADELMIDNSFDATWMPVISLPRWLFLADAYGRRSLGRQFTRGTLLFGDYHRSWAHSTASLLKTEVRCDATSRRCRLHTPIATLLPSNMRRQMPLKFLFSPARADFRPQRSDTAARSTSISSFVPFRQLQFIGLLRMALAFQVYA